MECGTIFLVGAGPGDRDLLTLRAARLIERAEVIVHDGLVSSDILAMASPGARLISVAKKRSKHTLPQEDINLLLVREAKAGRDVVRLKGGDPLIFGRGGEEAEMLVDNQVPFRVVPGITSAQGCSAYAGFPLTHRDHAQGVTFVTGHARADGSLDLDWRSLASRHHTLVFYMGLTNAELIRRELLANGLPADQPVALIERGTTREQRRVITRLGQLPETIQAEGLKPPTLIVVGEVVSLAGRLDMDAMTEAVA